jgi:hypothetical protein
VQSHQLSRHDDGIEKIESHLGLSSDSPILFTYVRKKLFFVLGNVSGKQQADIDNDKKGNTRTECNH